MVFLKNVNLYSIVGERERDVRYVPEGDIRYPIPCRSDVLSVLTWRECVNL